MDSRFVKLAGFLSRMSLLPELDVFQSYETSALLWPRPTAADLAAELLHATEFRSVGLGNWFGSSDAQVILQVVEEFAPPLYRQDIQLLAAALALASNLQHEEHREIGANVVLGAGSLVLLILIGTSLTKHLRTAVANLQS